MKVKSFTKFKRIFLVLLLGMLMFAANLGIFGILRPERRVFAASDISNGEFNPPSSNSTNHTAPSSSDYVTTVSSDTVRVTSGIVNLNSAEYNKYPKRNSGTTDQYVLAISSTTKRTLKAENGDPVEVEESRPTNFGYKTAYSITLQKNRYYKFSISAYTSNRNGIGKIALLNADDGDSVLVEKSAIVTPNNLWQDFYLLVSTTDVEYNVKFAMYLQGEGVVLYDSLKFETIDKAAFDADCKNTYQSAYFADEYTFDKRIESTDLSFVGSTTQAGAENGALKVSLNKTTTVGDIVGSQLEIERNILYRISVYAKAVNLSGKVELQLAPKDEDEPDSADVTSLSITNSQDEQGYEFYLHGHPLEAKNYIFKLSCDNASGQVYISHIVINYCDDNQFSNASAGSTLAKLDLASNFANDTISSNFVSNGTFNSGKVNDSKNPYPLSANNWTVITDQQNSIANAQHYGIVNLADKAKMQEKGQIFAPTLPETDPMGQQGNVLMLYPAAGTLSYIGPTNSVSSGYFKYVLNIRTQKDATVELISTNSNGEIVLLSKKVEGAQFWSSSSGLVLYGRAGYASNDVCLKITAANNSTTFVDEVKFYSNVSEEEFNSAQNKADLKVFLNKDLYSTSNVELSVVDAANYRFENESVMSTLNEQAATWEDKMALELRQSQAQAGKITSSLGYAFENGKYYKLCFEVYTNLMEVRQGEYDGDYGLNISLSGFNDNAIANVVTDRFVTYTFFVNATNSTTSYLTIEMGNSDVFLSGEAYIGNFKFEDDLTEQEFKMQSSNSTTKVLTTPAEENDDNNDNSSSDDEKEDTKTPINWNALMYVISSIIFGVALIIAIIGIVLRRVKFKKPVKKSKNEYDRNKTVSKQYYARKAIELKEAKLAELNAELKSLTEERSKYEDNYKADLSKLREAKIRRADKAEIGRLEKELKQNQKASASIGVSIARVESDIDYVNSASFINAVTRQLENEQRSEIVDDSQDDQQEVENKPAEKVDKKRSATKSASKKSTDKTTNKKSTGTKTAKTKKPADETK